MYIWDIKEEMIEARIPLPVYDDLYKALLLIQAAFELEPKLPSAARKIPVKVYEKYVKMKAKISEAETTNATASHSSEADTVEASRTVPTEQEGDAESEIPSSETSSEIPPLLR
jgi:hypothetical protein